MKATPTALWPASCAKGGSRWVRNPVGVVENVWPPSPKVAFGATLGFRTQPPWGWSKRDLPSNRRQYFRRVFRRFHAQPNPLHPPVGTDKKYDAMRAEIFPAH